MATQARGASTRAKNSEMAQRMKRLGIKRTTGRCCVCYKIIVIPTDNHFRSGGGCK